MDPQELVLATVKRWELTWFRYVMHHDSLSKTILQGTLEVGDAVVGRGGTEWMVSKSGHPCLPTLELLTTASC